MCANEKERGRAEARVRRSDVDDDNDDAGGGGRWFIAYNIVVIRIINNNVRNVVHTRDRNRLSVRARENVSHEAAHSSASTEAPPHPRP